MIDPRPREQQYSSKTPLLINNSVKYQEGDLGREQVGKVSIEHWNSSDAGEILKAHKEFLKEKIRNFHEPVFITGQEGWHAYKKALVNIEELEKEVNSGN